MEFTDNQKYKANKLREKLSANEYSFKKCNRCAGTGLQGFSLMCEGGFYWNGDYCEKCDGSGFIDWEDSPFIHICPGCDGTGRDACWDLCEACEGSGVLDWVQRVTRSHLLPAQSLRRGDL